MVERVTSNDEVSGSIPDESIRVFVAQSVARSTEDAEEPGSKPGKDNVCVYSVMVTSKPSKLELRVRFPVRAIPKISWKYYSIVKLTFPVKHTEQMPEGLRGRS